jgi:DNA-binding transcriptional LysR family regulator
LSAPSASAFERSTRKISLTPSGEIFHQHALRALDAIHSTEVAVRNMGDAPHGVLRISASITFGRMYIAPLLPIIVAKYPDLNCELVLTDHLVDLVEENIDLALRLTKTPPEDAVARKLVHMKRVICATPGYFAAHGEPRTPHELAHHACFSLLQLNESRIWRLIDAQGEEVSVPVTSKFLFNDIDCVMNAVLAGHGIGMLLTYLCGPALARVNFARSSTISSRSIASAVISTPATRQTGSAFRKSGSFLTNWKSCSIPSPRGSGQRLPSTKRCIAEYHLT